MLIPSSKAPSDRNKAYDGNVQIELHGCEIVPQSVLVEYVRVLPEHPPVHALALVVKSFFSSAWHRSLMAKV